MFRLISRAQGLSSSRHDVGAAGLRLLSTAAAPQKRVFANVEELKTCVGESLGPSEWVELSQEKIDMFADATGDHQWIHTDVERCKAESPYKNTIAHGFLTLSLAPKFMYQLVEVGQVKMLLNYGTNKVRFIRPVVAGSLVRGTAVVASVEESRGAAQAVFKFTFEEKSSGKPVCVADMVVRFVL